MHIRVKGNMGGYVTFHRHVGRGGGGGSFEGVRSNPLFGLQKILYTPQIYISALLFASGLLILLLLRITSVQASLVAVLWLAEQQVGCNC